MLRFHAQTEDRTREINDYLTISTSSYIMMFYGLFDNSNLKITWIRQKKYIAFSQPDYLY